MTFSQSCFDIDSFLIVFIFTYEQDTLFMEVEVL